jgi:hypothetical protein
MWTLILSLEMGALKGYAKKEDGEIGSLEGLFICQSNL